MFYLKLQIEVLHGNISMGIVSNATSLFAQGVTDEEDNEELTWWGYEQRLVSCSPVSISFF